MPQSQHHTVQRVSITAHRPTRTGSYELQERFSAWFWSQGAEALQAVLDECAPPEAVLRLEELVVDLDYLQLATLETDLESVFRRVLRETLREQLGRIDRPWSGITRIADSVATRIFAQWLFFLEFGYEPWWGTLRRTEAAYREAVHATLAAEPRAALELLDLLRRSTAAIDRLAYGHPPAEQQALVGALTGSRLADLADVEKKWFEWEERYRTELAPLLTIQFATDRQRQASFRRFTWRYLSDHGPLAGQQQAAAALLAAFLQQRLLPPARSGAEIETLLRRVRPTAEVRSVLTEWVSSFTDPAARSLQKVLRVGAGTKNRNISPESVARGANDADLPRPGKLTDERSADTAESRHSRRDEQTSATSTGRPTAGTSVEEETAAQRATGPPLPAVQEGDVFYFSAAGVVLLHPFLAPLFTNLGYWQADAYTDDGAWQRAVVLTHFLATATEMPPEEDLILPKLLCGRAFAQPVHQLAPLTENERQEADDLLRSVVKHWGAIGAATPAGLREGFFDREGKLERRSGRWELTVERKAQDLLLGRLPWGISLIKLPWLPEMIHVTW